jgi:hypothetical protein
VSIAMRVLIAQRQHSMAVHVICETRRTARCATMVSCAQFSSRIPYKTTNLPHIRGMVCYTC